MIILLISQVIKRNTKKNYIETTRYFFFLYSVQAIKAFAHLLIQHLGFLLSDLLKRLLRLGEQFCLHEGLEISHLHTLFRLLAGASRVARFALLAFTCSYSKNVSPSLHGRRGKKFEKSNKCIPVSREGSRVSGTSIKSFNTSFFLLSGL